MERELEDFKVEIKNSKELQVAVESNKVAASQAITQNNKLKAELEKLNQIIEHQVIVYVKGKYFISLEYNKYLIKEINFSRIMRKWYSIIRLSKKE